MSAPGSGRPWPGAPGAGRSGPPCGVGVGGWAPGALAAAGRGGRGARAGQGGQGALAALAVALPLGGVGRPQGGRVALGVGLARGVGCPCGACACEGALGRCAVLFGGAGCRGGLLGLARRLGRGLGGPRPGPWGAGRCARPAKPITAAAAAQAAITRALPRAGSRLDVHAGCHPPHRPKQGTETGGAGDGQRTKTDRQTRDEPVARTWRAIQTRGQKARVPRDRDDRRQSIDVARRWH